MMNSKRTAKWLGAAAVAAIIAGGAVETGFVAPNTAHAELRSLQQPILACEAQGLGEYRPGYKDGYELTYEYNGYLRSIGRLAYSCLHCY